MKNGQYGIDPEKVAAIRNTIAQPVSEASFANVIWRLGNLYHIVDKHGQRVRFVPNDAQCDFLYWVFVLNWRRATILKARQLGFSTVIGLIGLDHVLFHENSIFNVQSHNDDAAKELLREKIKYPFSQLPEELRLTVDQKNSSANELTFGDFWKVRSRVKIRGGTSQVLHISEWGKVQATDPLRSEEILTGALPTATSPHSYVFNESTFEGGKTGHFYDQIVAAMNVDHNNRTPFDSVFLFYPWYDDKNYAIPCAPGMLRPFAIEYFDNLKAQHGIELSDDQKLWWQKQKEVQGMFMGREFPSTPEEAMDAPVHGAIYADILNQMETEGGHFDVNLYVNPKLPVFSVWDIGWTDYTAIWCVQWDGKQLLWHDYFEDNKQYPEEYIRYLNALPFDHHGIILPHDAATPDRTGAINYISDIRAATNDSIPVRVLPQTKDKWLGINDLRRYLKQSTFHSERCGTGLQRLRKYRVKVNAKDGSKSGVPIHCDGSDAARYVAEAIKHNYLDTVMPSKTLQEMRHEQMKIQPILNDE